MRRTVPLLFAAMLAAPGFAQAQVARFCENRFVVEEVTVTQTTRFGEVLQNFVFRIGNASDASLPYSFRAPNPPLQTRLPDASGTLVARETGRRVWAVEERLGRQGATLRTPMTVPEMLSRITVDCTPPRISGGRA
jgi:hypothetical protein